MRIQIEKTFLETIIQSIKQEIQSSVLKNNILSVVLFGSVQNKEDDSRSDFDVLVLVDKEDNVSSTEEEIEKVSTKLTKSYGITLGPSLTAKSR